jgi:hypothetical protein
MASTINASTSSGIVQTADTSGNLNLQSGGTTIVAITSSGAAITGAVTGLTDLTTTGNTILGNASTDTLNVGNGGLVKDASGNVGIGVTPSAWGAGHKVIQLESFAALDGNSGATYLSNNWYSNAGNKYIGTGQACLYAQSIGAHSWYTAPSGTAGNAITFTQAMTLDASGNLMVGATGNAGTGAIVYANGTFAGTGYNTRTGIGGSFTGNSFNINWTGSVAELYIATTKVVANLSDYRFKKNIVSQTDAAISKVMNLHPVVYELADNGIYKGDGIVREGFIAHELAEIIPSAVEGAKDQVDEEGKDIPQGLKLDAIVSVLTKAIQEQQAMIDELKAKVAALEAA